MRLSEDVCEHTMHAYCAICVYAHKPTGEVQLDVRFVIYFRNYPQRWQDLVK